MSAHDLRPTAADESDLEEAAAQIFVRRQLGPWSELEETELNIRLKDNPAFADAFTRVGQSWVAVGERAATAELIVLREQALARARRSNSRRWRLAPRSLWRRGGVRAGALAASVLLALAAAYQWAPFGFRPGEYRTAIGEQRVIELEDHSRVALDAATRLKVRFTDGVRILHLLEGKAQFSVAHDPQRPFKVHAGARTVVALGTKFVIEYSDEQFKLAMLEGKVAVIPDPSPSSSTRSGVESVDSGTARAPQPAPSHQKKAAEQVRTAQMLYANNALVDFIELSAGEALQVDRGGEQRFIANADLRAASAWREGKIIFEAEPLGEAVRSLNRYSRLQIEIVDPALANVRVSGIFDTGDTRAFIDAVQSSFSVVTDYSDRDTIRLRAR